MSSYRPRTAPAPPDGAGDGDRVPPRPQPARARGDKRLNHHHPTRACAAALLLGATGAASAAGPYMIPVTPFVQAQFGQKEQEFEQLLDQSLSFYMLRIGAGIVAQNAVISLTTDWSITDADVSEEEETGSADRREYDLSVGYALPAGFTVFGGYKFGETRIDLVSREAIDAGAPETFENTFEEAGPYIGGSWEYVFEQAGAVSFSFAYAWLDADNRFGGTVDEADEGDEPEFDDFLGRVRADANGIGLGVRWSKGLTDTLGYYATVRWQRYDQDLSQQGLRVSAQETFTELGMGLTYSF